MYLPPLDSLSNSSHRMRHRGGIEVFAYCQELLTTYHQCSNIATQEIAAKQNRGRQKEGVPTGGSTVNTEELMARLALGVDTSEAYVEWAVDRLVAGSPSENMAILAGLDLEKPIDGEDVQKYFRRACKELGIDWPDSRTALRRYSEWLCHELLSGRATPSRTLRSLAQLSLTSSDSESLPRIWDELEVDWLLLEEGGHPGYNCGLTPENRNQYLRQMAAQYLQLLSIDLPTNFFYLAHCSTCEAIEEPWTKTISPYLVCHRCGSGDIQSMHGYEARQAFLTQHEPLTSR